MIATTSRRLPRRFRPYDGAAPPDRVYLVIGAYCWGKGPELAKAIAKCRKHSSGEFRPASSRAILYHAHPETTISPDGFIVTPAGEEHRAREITILEEIL